MQRDCGPSGGGSFPVSAKTHLSMELKKHKRNKRMEGGKKRKLTQGDKMLEKDTRKLYPDGRSAGREASKRDSASCKMR